MINQLPNLKLSGTKFITELYQTVDSRSVEGLSLFLADDVNFQFANAPCLQGKAAVLEANASFFKTITAMAHQIDNVWSHGDDVMCNGQVHYTRLDGSHLTVPFATILKLQCEQITDYLIYVDISEL